MTPMLACPAGTGQATFEPDDELPAVALFLSPDELDELDELLPESPDTLLVLAPSLDPFSLDLLSPEPPSFDELSLAEPFADDPAGTSAVELLRLSVR